MEDTRETKPLGEKFEVGEEVRLDKEFQNTSIVKVVITNT